MHLTELHLSHTIQFCLFYSLPFCSDVSSLPECCLSASTFIFNPIDHLLGLHQSASCTIGYFSVYYYTNCVSLKSICASLNVKLCIFKNHFMPDSVTTLPQTPQTAGEGIKFGQLILRRIVKIVATKCQILRLKSLSAGPPPHTPLGELTALPQAPSWI